MSLSDEINNDPAGRGYATSKAAGNNLEVLRLLNEPVQDEIGARVIPSTELLIWGGQAGRLARLSDAATSGATEQVRSMADAALRMVQRADTSLDYSRAEIAGMVDGLKQAQVFTADDVASLKTLATRKISRAEVVEGRLATLNDVRGAV